MKDGQNFPIDFQHPDPIGAGFSPDGISRLEKSFQSQINAGLHPGAQLVVLRHGKVIVDLAAGSANLKKGRPVTQTTLFPIFSCTKSFTAVCIHQLVESGKLELDAPVAEYWPAFGCKGKQTATVRHTLLHQAGVPNNGQPWQVLLWGNRRLLSRQVAGMSALWEPGSRMEYHLVNGGFILGELIYRVSGLSPANYLKQHFLQPLGMKHTYPGLPYRLFPQSAHVYNTDPTQNNAQFVFNRAVIRHKYLPAASICTTARDLAVFYQMLNNLGTYNGKQFLKPETIQQATALAYDGPNNTPEKRIRWALGFTLGGYSEFLDQDIYLMGKGSSKRTFGHPGQGGAALAWADPDSGIVFAFVNNHFQNAVTTHRRFEILANCVWEALLNRV